MSNTSWLTAAGVLVKMNDNTLIRRKNLAELGLAPADLAARVGNSKQYWSDMLRNPKKSFGEVIARKIEERLGLPRGCLDEDGRITTEVGEPLSQKVTGKNAVEENSSGVQNGADAHLTIPTSMPYSAPNLKSTILLMGSLIGALDTRSRAIIGDMLKDLALHTDDAQDIAEKASALATVQKPLTRNKALNKALRGRKDAVETERGPLEH